MPHAAHSGVSLPDLPSFAQGRQTLQDKIRLLDQVVDAANNPSTKLLETLIPGGKKTQQVFSNGHTFIVLADFWQWEDEQIYYADQVYAGSNRRHIFYPAGKWWNKDSGETGHGVISLAGSIQRVVLDTAFEWIAKMLGIFLDTCEVPQLAMRHEDIHIEQAESSGMIPVAPHFWLGWPSHSYPFVTEFGQLSFLLDEWLHPEGKVQLFRSLIIDGPSKGLEWKSVRPPAGTIIFNKHRLLHEPHLPVCIYDDIALANQHAFSPHTIATWAGDKDFAMEIDWSMLAGREVSYSFNKNLSSSFTISCHLRGIFHDMQTELNLEFYEGSHG